MCYCFRCACVWFEYNNWKFANSNSLNLEFKTQKYGNCYGFYSLDTHSIGFSAFNEQEKEREKHVESIFKTEMDFSIRNLSVTNCIQFTHNLRVNQWIIIETALSVTLQCAANEMNHSSFFSRSFFFASSLL